MRSHIGFTIVLALLVSAALQASTSAQSSALIVQLSGRVKGTVMDLNEAKIPGVIVVFETVSTKLEAVSDASGNYEIELPAGTYQITCRVNLFLLFRRAPLLVQGNTTTMVNIVMWPVASDIANPPVYYQSFSVLDARNTGLSLLIQFLSRRKVNRLVEYKNALASYNALTISASKLEFNPKSLQLRAKGNVVVEDGRQRVHVRRAQVTFKMGEPILKLAQ